MIIRALLLVALLSSPLFSDVILVDVGGGNWKEISFVAGQVTTIPVSSGTTELRMVRLDFDGDPNPGPGPKPDPPTPTGLRADIATAAKSANDNPNAEQLKTVYQSAELLSDAGASLPTIVDLIVKSESAILNTPDEIAKWSPYRSLTTPILNANPITAAIKPKITEIKLGLSDAITP